MKLLVIGTVFLTLNFGVDVSYLQDKFEERFKESVARPYLLGMDSYFTVINHIIEELSESSSDSAFQIPQPISKEFVNATATFSGHISNASKNAHELYKETDELLAMQIRMIKNLTNQINQNDDMVYQLTTEIQRKEYNARSTKLEVEAKKVIVDGALEQVKNLEAQFYKAQTRCLGRKRFRRSVGSDIGKWFVGAFNTVKKGVEEIPKVAKIAGNAIYQGFCEFLNLFTRRIRNAKAALVAAENQLSNSIEAWNSATVELAYLEESKKHLATRRAELVAEIDVLTIKKVEQRTSLNEIAGLEHQMQMCVEALNEVKAQAHTIRNMTQLGEILEPTKIVDPMIVVADKIVMMDEDAGLPKMSADKIASLKMKLNKLIRVGESR